jgi:multicomponent Na+:H+ antiporter subunit E
MTGTLDLILRLTVWFLLTADGSLANVVIGVSFAFLLPIGYAAPGALQDWLLALGETLVAIPQAYLEAFALICFPHREEEISLELVKPGRTPGLIFLDIFLITFTPKTLVLKYHEDGWYQVHRLQRRRKG